MVVFQGRVWVLRDQHGLIDDIDTDQIYHNSYLAVTDMSEMGKYALGNLRGWEHFAGEAKNGDIVMAGKNFGAGSSRQHAVDCFISLGISCILARSYAPIYRRNAINSGFPVLQMREIDLEAIETGDVICVDTDACTILRSGEIIGRIVPMSQVQREIYEAGNIFLYAKRMEGQK